MSQRMLLKKHPPMVTTTTTSLNDGAPIPLKVRLQRLYQEPLTWRWLSVLLLISSCLHALQACPYSKVEESFQIQATHDLFYHGVTPALFRRKNLPYDHLQYPGVVPRTFWGPLVLAKLTKATQWILWLVSLLRWDIGDYPFQVQFVARFWLLLLFVVALLRLVHALDRRTHARTIGTLLVTITATQFHLPFYASRLLPNTFSTILCIWAYSYWLDYRPNQNVNVAARILVGTMIIFRCDVLLLLASCGVSWLYMRQLTIPQALLIGIQTMLISLILTVPLDSLLWRRFVWPEGTVLYYNTVLGKSSDWGTSPWHWYGTNALPKSLLFLLPLVPLSVLKVPELIVAKLRKKNSLVSAASIVDPTWMPVVLPAVLFVLLYSFLGHKEMRFLFPVIPLFNVAAAVGWHRVYTVLVVLTTPHVHHKKDDDHPHVHFNTEPKSDKTNESASSSKDQDDDKPVIPSSLAQLIHVGCIGLLVLNWIASMIFVHVSRHNYPGGHALEYLTDHVVRHHVNKNGGVHVHVDVASAMTGVSLFGQRAAEYATEDWNLDWSFDKAGYEEEHRIKGSKADYWKQFTHILTEDATLGGEAGRHFEVVEAIQGHPRLSWKKLAYYALMRWRKLGEVFVTQDAIFVLERQDLYDEKKVKAEKELKGAAEKEIKAEEEVNGEAKEIKGEAKIRELKMKGEEP